MIRNNDPGDTFPGLFICLLFACYAAVIHLHGTNIKTAYTYTRGAAAILYYHSNPVIIPGIIIYSPIKPYNTF